MLGKIYGHKYLPIDFDSCHHIWWNFLQIDLNMFPARVLSFVEILNSHVRSRTTPVQNCREWRIILCPQTRSIFFPFVWPTRRIIVNDPKSSENRTYTWVLFWHQTIPEDFDGDPGLYNGMKEIIGKIKEYLESPINPRADRKLVLTPFLEGKLNILIQNLAIEIRKVCTMHGITDSALKAFLSYLLLCFVSLFCSFSLKCSLVFILYLVNPCLKVPRLIFHIHFVYRRFWLCVYSILVAELTF